MWIKYVGHPDGADVPLPGPLGGEMFCPYNEPVNVEAGLAKRLLEQPTNWRAAAPMKDEKDEKVAGKAGKDKA